MQASALPRYPALASIPRLVVPQSVDGEGVSPDQVAAEPTPEWDAVVALLGDPTEVAR